MSLRPCKECGKEISSDAKSCPHCGKQVKTAMGAGTGCLVIIIGSVVVIAIGLLMNKTNPGGGGEGKPAVSPSQAALSQVKLDYRWRKAGFDNVMEGDFIVKNDSNYNIKDFEITCHHFAKSGTEIDSNARTVYDVVKAHSTKKFPNFNMGFIHTQAATSSCTITSLSVAP